ncbi:uncharacterized protein LOC134256524 [Saccostrea cucullata]|uniref:uncharacterized protein LOC134256524 n=1 Tax=Saccostrea cuccullata TaxID=36930 RepID=UPI002ED6B76B
MDTPKEEKSIPNFSEFQFSSLNSVSDKPVQISKPQPFNDIYLPDHKYDKITAGSLNISEAQLNCEPGSVMNENCSSLRTFTGKPASEIIPSNCETKCSNNILSWEILPNIGSMKHTTGNRNSQELSSGCFSAEVKTGRPDTPLQPRPLNTLSASSKRRRSSPDKKAESRPTEGMNERKSNECHTVSPKENCNISRGINSQLAVPREILADEILLHDRLSSADNFDLKSSSSVGQDSLSSQESMSSRKGNGWQNKCAHSRTNKSPLCGLSTATTLSPTMYSNIRACPSTFTSDPRCVKSCSDLFINSNDSQEISLTDDDFEKDENGTSVNFNIHQHNNLNQHLSHPIKKNVTKISSTDTKPVKTCLENTEKNTTHSKNFEEVQIPMVKEIKSGEQTEPQPKKNNIQEYKEMKKIKKTANSNNSLELRKAYDVKQRAEIKNLTGLKLKKPQNKMNIKRKRIIFKKSCEYEKGIQRENDKIVFSGEVSKHRKKKQFVVDYTKENLAIYSTPGKTLFVKLESEINHLPIDNTKRMYELGKMSQTRIILHQEENTGHEYEDDYENDEDDPTSNLGAELFDLRNNISLLDSRTTNREACRMVENRSSYVEMDRQLKASLGIRKEVSAQATVFNDDQTTSEQFLCATAAKTYAYSTNPGQSVSYSGYVSLPPIEMNNFVVQRIPKHSFSQNKTGGLAKNVLSSRNKATETSRRNLSQRHWSAQSETKGIQKSSISLPSVKKPAPKYDIDILETRAKAPSFDTHLDG